MNRFKTAAFAALLATGLLSAGARAQMICRQLDVPGAAYTQGFQINNAGQIAFGTDLGGFIYSGGTFQQLPQPPASSGLAASDIAALGVNDYGVTAGAAGAQGFLLSGGNYSFYRYPSDAPARTYARTVSNSGIVLGESDQVDSTGNVLATTAFIYNPAGAALYPAGFTALAPTLPDGRTGNGTIPGGMNDAGVFVGSARFRRQGTTSFVYDPRAAQPYSFFQVNGGSRTYARGINNAGQVAGSWLTSDGILAGFLRDASGDHFFTCPELDSSGGIFVSSLNDNGLMSGDVFDAQGNFHGLVIYPDVGAAIADLEGAVTGQGPGRSLEAKIDAVASANARGNSKAACAQLRSFLQEVAAQSGKSISSQLAASFTAEAQSIQHALACP